jgi:putative oxidoreductase
MRMLTRWSEYAALPLRGVLGALFVVLGYMKLAEPGLARTAEIMGSVGLAPGIAWAWVAGLIELVGGAALILGVLTRWAALVLALESLAALAAIAAGAPINIEARVAMFAGLLALGLIGPQRYALDTRVPALSSWAGARSVESARKAA